MRLFIAIPVEEALKEKLITIQNEISQTQAHVKLVEPENIHLTVRFLGEVSSEQSAVVSSIIKKVASGYKRFEMDLKGIGAFPSINNPRILWVGCHEAAGENKLVRIYQDIEKSLLENKFAPNDKPFSAHITLGRVKSPNNNEMLTRLLSKRAEFSAGKQFVKEIILFQSQLNTDGPGYSVVESASLL
ncbi:MAG: RNA 2',3'-cyclic phosphodiesterase [Planctomycetes bacterium]|nr:RNA 2',3'-cyclic phosphodiesterase [Planctomycetota bacterium]